MRAVVQRVDFADVTVEGREIGKIGMGIMALIGIEKDDSYEDLEYIAKKLVNLRIFKDENQKMNLSILDVDGEILLISQFTLLGDARKGNRPSFIQAKEPTQANELFNKLVENVSKLINKKVHTGEFGADMNVRLLNQGPVTILLDSKKIF